MGEGQGETSLLIPLILALSRQGREELAEATLKDKQVKVTELKAAGCILFVIACSLNHKDIKAVPLPFGVMAARLKASQPY